jgi:hypothetical protein
LLILISLFVERFFIQKDIQLVNAKISSMMKNDVLAINGRLRRTFATNPKPVYDALVKRQRTIRQEISTVQSAMGIRALSPLVQISQLAASTKATLTELKVSDIDEIQAVFTAENEADLMNLKSQLERATFADLNLDINKEKLLLRLSATGQ